MTAAENIAAAKEALTLTSVQRPRKLRIAEGLAALDALAADLTDLTDSLRLQSEQREHAVGRMRAAEQALHAGQERWGEALGRAAAAEARVETLTRERGEWKAKYEARDEAQPSDVEFYGR